MSEQIPWWHVGPTQQSNPFSSLGTDYCPRCKLERECDMAAVHSGDTFTYKKWCLRCGKVISFGMYDHVLVMSRRPLPPAAFEWCFEAGKDKR